MTREERLARQDAPTSPAAPPGAREWLADIARYAVADAERVILGHHVGGAYPYVVGYLLGVAQLSEQESNELYRRCQR